jgi:hypothetical protein
MIPPSLVSHLSHGAAGIGSIAARCFREDCAIGA